MRVNTSWFEQPTQRPLKAYAFDPSQGRHLGNHITLNVQYEELKPGPVGRHLAVIDYDASNDCYYAPVDLDDASLVVSGGLDPDEGDPRFHQQMVYAVASETIKRFEIALGRMGKWAFRRGGRNDPLRHQLRIFPHAMQEANAYYSRDLGALLFGYFPASGTEMGTNLPGQTIFTCLSHDIIVHEMTHALIDGQREFFMEPTGPDTLAFHEAFADIVALFQHFSYREPLLEVISKTGGLIHRMDMAPEIAPVDSGPVIQAELSTTNPLVQLARQFGEAMGMRAALRQALGTPPNSRKLDTLFEPHERGAILVAAVFDAFFTVYLRRTRDLFRIAYGGGSIVTPKVLHPDLVGRLAREATKTAELFANICIRALDYCPPVDITFGEFLRALITADYEVAPDDQYDYRGALIEAFRSRGIWPEDVTSTSEQQIRWAPFDERPRPRIERPIRVEGLQFDPLLETTATPEQQSQNAATLHELASSFPEALGLSRDAPIRAHSFHLMDRVGPDGKRKVQVVAELIQRREIRLVPNAKNSPTFTFRGGTTLILTRDGHVRYAIQKRLAAPRRLERQLEYYATLGVDSGRTAYFDVSPFEGRHMNFNLMHRGY